MKISNPAQRCVICFERYPLLYSEYSGPRFHRNTFIWHQMPKDCNPNISHYSILCFSLGFSVELLRRNWENSGLLLRTFQLHSTEWSKCLCAPDNYNTIIRCTETFWSPCISQKVTVELVTVFECILTVCFCMSTLTEVFPSFFLSCKANARVKPATTGHGPHSS
jgi:hypothetical protein